MTNSQKNRLMILLIIVIAVTIIISGCGSDTKNKIEKQYENSVTVPNNTPYNENVSQNNTDHTSNENLYRLFLENSVKVNIDNSEYSLKQYIEEKDALGMKFEYTFFDMNGDGITEFHLKSPRSYDIFTINDEKIKLWYEGSPYETFTNDGGVFYTRQGGAPERIDYQYFSLDYDENVVSTISFSEVHEGSNNGTADGLFFDGNGNEISYDEFKALFNKCGEIPYNHEWTVFYNGLKTEIFKDIDITVEKDIKIQYPSVIGMQNNDLQKNVNSVIKEAALERYNEYSADLFKDGFDNTSWYVDYTISHPITNP